MLPALKPIPLEPPSLLNSSIKAGLMSPGLIPKTLATESRFSIDFLFLFPLTNSSLVPRL